ncbi:SDR family oxidoreductase [Shewanella acanthi]|uniref:SDR family oxidoreductase n=1 Tax=Shewanella acanthi TaxID=2864212 RepID=UPI001C66175E|nr:SDR family oxidoreductase [Shewanella acanthi]QYJ78342.1 SDR family oxidoreductase [Shewanella acanthi]
MSQRLLKKVAIITGSAQGIGESIARLFAEHGADLILFDLNAQKLETLANELTDKFGCKVLPVSVDVSDALQVQAAIETSLTTFKRIDVLVNNAGVNVFSDLNSLELTDWERCLNINLKGAMLCTKAILPTMLNQSYGHIVNISSTHGHKIIRGALPYTVSKHGLLGLTKSVGIEYADRGIRANSISPGLIDTPIAQKYFNEFPEPELEKLRQENFLPCKRMGNPTEVAYTALFLASDEALFINATDILIDGGRCQVYLD